MNIYSNNANCDIYIGTGAGCKLDKDLKEAKKSIKIVSPYISLEKLKELISYKEKGVDIHLFTLRNSLNKLNDDFLRKILIQERTTDIKAENNRQKQKKRLKIIKILLFVSIVFVSMLIYLTNSVLNLFLVTPIFLLYLYMKKIKNKIRITQIFSYKYTNLFDINVYSDKNNLNGNTFIHAKIYIIDEKIVYLGSLNFSNNGFSLSMETRIRTTDKNVSEKVLDTFAKLINDPQIACADMFYLKRRLYKEPIN